MYASVYILLILNTYYELLDFYRILYTVCIIIISFLYNQLMVSTIGIIIKNKSISLAFALIFQLNFVNVNNFFKRLIDTIPLFQYMSIFSQFYYYFNSMLEIIYGLNRCSTSGQFSLLLHEYDIQDFNLFKQIKIYLILLFGLLLIEFLLFEIINSNISKKFLKLGNYFISLFPKRNNIRDLNENYEINNNTKESDNKIIEDKKLLSIAWINLTISIPINKHFFSSKNFRILDNICGSFDEQSLNALMGPSGAGKTTLLKCFNAKYHKYLSQESEIYSNFRKNTRNCFIQQNISEHLISGLTVKQTLIFASKLKNSRIIVGLDHNLIINKLMSELLINDLVDTCVESCSGGERKRIAIATELTAYSKPNMLCIDEPTSGLDSNAAKLVFIINHQRIELKLLKTGPKVTNKVTKNDPKSC